MRTQLFSLNLGIKEICKIVKQCHSFHYIFLKIVSFAKLEMCFLYKHAKSYYYFKNYI